ncbi:UNVERIFIED_ORG: hypothetical protein GGE44_003081 [Rhizobium esperanzae]
MTTAITREKTIKKWPRQWKLNLIERENSEWEEISVSPAGSVKILSSRGRATAGFL